MTSCTFIGLGNMGFPMAGHLATNGHQVSVYNRTPSTSDRWVKRYPGEARATPAKAAADAEIVFICVGGDKDVRAVLEGDDGVLSTLAEGCIIVDHTTSSASLARELYDQCKSMGIGFVDAPISGGQSGAENGQLSIMCGGEPSVLEKIRPVLSVYGKSIVHIGGPGSGQQTKMVNQILCAGAIQGAAEALAFGKRAGLDMELVLQAVSQGAAGSWYLSNRGETMLSDEFDFGFAVDWMSKDLDLVSEEASTVGSTTPLVQLTRQYLRESQAVGENGLDATVIVRRYLDT